MGEEEFYALKRLVEMKENSVNVGKPQAQSHKMQVESKENKVVQLSDGSFFFVKDVVRVYVLPHELVSGFPVKDRCCIFLPSSYNKSHKHESYMFEYFNNTEEAKAFCDTLIGMIGEQIVQLSDGSFFLANDVVRVYYYPRELVSGFPVKDRCSIIISHVYSSSHKPESFMREYFDNPEEAKAFYDKLKGMIEEKARSDVKNI